MPKTRWSKIKCVTRVFFRKFSGVIAVSCHDSCVIIFQIRHTKFLLVISCFTICITPICMHIAQPPLPPLLAVNLPSLQLLVVFQGRRVKREEAVRGGG